MTFVNLFRARPAMAPLTASACPFCVGSSAMGGALCNVCRAEALNLGRLRA